MFTWSILLCDSKRSFYHFAELYICIYLDLKKWFCVRYVSSSLLALMSLSRLTRKKSPSLRCISQNRVSVILLNIFLVFLEDLDWIQGQTLWFRYLQIEQIPKWISLTLLEISVMNCEWIQEALFCECFQDMILSFFP